MDLKGKRVVVTGGAGFIGSHIVDQLLAEEEVAEVVVFDNFCRGKRDNLAGALKDPRCKVVEGDLLYQDLLERTIQGADVVFHLAALWLLHCYEYPRSAFKVNIEGTFNVLDACVRHGVKKLVYSSSASVYGNAVSLPMNEDHPLNNRNFYGATKVASEQMCRAFNDRYGLDYVGLRYMNVYGARQAYGGAYTEVIMKMLERLDQGLGPVVYGDGSQTYDFVYVTDVARANLCAAKSDVSDDFFNVGTGVPTSIKQLAEMLLKVKGVDLPITYNPQGRTFVTRRVGGTEKARRLLGFEAKLDLEAGLRGVVQWWDAARRPAVSSGSGHA
ncbi:MAG: NAD-dependent epimerase/dehydratase family protein [Chloroflexi bacterium]|nr:NAD-dependent epimerase/dehydratase family protein [Chloroflexota bacterium]